VAEGLARPAEPRVSPVALALVFGRISSTSFGGGQMSAIRREVVRRNKWLSEPDYLELLAIAQVAPGPNPTSVAVLIGGRLAGPLGAAAALLGATVPGFVILLAIAALALDPRLGFLRGALRGCAAAAMGLTLANALEMTWPFRRKLVDLVLIAAAALGVVFLHLSLALTLLILVPIALLVTARERTA